MPIAQPARAWLVHWSAGLNADQRDALAIGEAQDRVARAVAVGVGHSHISHIHRAAARVVMPAHQSGRCQ